jgi:hypothetical protein
MALRGCVVCISGTLSVPRAELVEEIEEAGGRVSTTVTAATTHLVSAAIIRGAERAAKVRDALAKGVPVVDQDWLDASLDAGEALDTHAFAALPPLGGGRSRKRSRSPAISSAKEVPPVTVDYIFHRSPPAPPPTALRPADADDALRLLLFVAPPPLACLAFAQARPALSALQEWLGAAVCLRWGLTLCAVLACLPANPAFLRLDLKATVAATTSRTAGGPAAALVYFLSPFTFVMLALLQSAPDTRAAVMALVLGAAVLDGLALSSLSLAAAAAAGTASGDGGGESGEAHALPTELLLSHSAAAASNLAIAALLLSECARDNGGSVWRALRNDSESRWIILGLSSVFLLAVVAPHAGQLVGW